MIWDKQRINNGPNGALFELYSVKVSTLANIANFTTKLTRLTVNNYMKAIGYQEKPGVKLCVLYSYKTYLNIVLVPDCLLVEKLKFMN